MTSKFGALPNGSDYFATATEPGSSLLPQRELTTNCRILTTDEMNRVSLCNLFMNWSNIGMIQWLIKEIIKRHLSDAAKLIKSFTSYLL